MNKTTRPEADPSADKAALFARLRKLKRQCQQDGTDKHNQVMVLIAACIDEGITSGSHIVGTIAHLGFTPGHVGILLKENIGHYWQRDAEKRYSTLPPMS